ncbi:MAG: AAA family ATPase [Candidatus Sumerlaeia bacterium]|nr:AAA family ATPase [Candidatus Sumerlaeia bacterium]
MIFTRIELQNWRNFTKADVPLAGRSFIVGPNASGKSNFLDAFRFLHDLVVEGGGLARAVEVRGGIARLRSLHQKGTNSNVGITVELADGDAPRWWYRLEINRDQGGAPVVRHEEVRRLNEASEETVLSRPNGEDKADPRRLGQTAIQQLNANREFRELADFFASVLYLHVVPQLIREAQGPPAGAIGQDTLGRDLLDRMRDCNKRTLAARLNRIQEILAVAVPQFEEIQLETDDRGRPHLKAKFKHWRGNGAYQNEAQFSDGTLRLIGLLWAMQEKGGPLLLEEPELSLHSALLPKLPAFIQRARKAAGGRQVILSTHSEHMLSDPGIGADEVLVATPSNSGSTVSLASSDEMIAVSMNQAGLTAAEAVLPRTRAEQADLFDTLRP